VARMRMRRIVNARFPCKSRVRKDVAQATGGTLISIKQKLSAARRITAIIAKLPDLPPTGCGVTVPPIPMDKNRDGGLFEFASWGPTGLGSAEQCPRVAGPLTARD
jgi:hypothetical protein